jgi:hypothetical protein
MIDSLAKSLVANGLQPDSFTASRTGEGIFLGELPAGRVLETWIKLANAARETKYWPIICGGTGDLHEQVECDPASILASAPSGTIREILQPRMQQRRELLASMSPEFAAATDMDQLAQLADASGIYSFGGPGQAEQQWPTEADAPTRGGFHTVRERKGKPAALLLVRVEHSYEVPAYLGFGGWNDCPPPELQVAVLREWKNDYQARPACISGDVLECAVVNRPQSESQSMRLAAEQWIFCEDIVSQGTQSVRKLAMGIWRSPTWFFWWD